MRRSRRISIALPGETHGRRGFLLKGIGGAALLAVAGGGWLASRRTAIAPGAAGPLRVFAPEEVTVLLAVADRLLPPAPGFPRPPDLGLGARMDAAAALLHPGDQQDLKRLVRLLESPLAALVLDGDARLFTASQPERQDRRLAAWAGSRIPLRRTGFQALRRLVYASYYGSPETWAAVGYPGPPVAAPAAPAPPQREVKLGE